MRTRIMLRPRSSRRRPQGRDGGDVELDRTGAKVVTAGEAVAAAQRFLKRLDTPTALGHDG
jgi:hypothetical protein